MVHSVVVVVVVAMTPAEVTFVVFLCMYLLVTVYTSASSSTSVFY